MNFLIFGYAHLLVIVIICILNFLECQFAKHGTAIYLNVLDETSATGEYLLAPAAFEILVRRMGLKLSV